MNDNQKMNGLAIVVVGIIAILTYILTKILG
jgi:hypothetical protein